MQNIPTLLTCSTLGAALLLSGCAKQAEIPKKTGPSSAIITVAQAQSRSIQVLELSMGEADSITAPKVGAEVSGRITRVEVETGDPVKKGQLLAEIDATDYSTEVRRLEALAVTQQKLTERHRDLASKGFISASKLEEMEALKVSTHEQLARAAKNLSRTRINSPVDGIVDSRMVSVGDWIELGKPAFQLSTSEKLLIRLPFPETAASRIKIGQTVTLTTPTAPTKTMTGKIAQVRPAIGGATRAFDAIVAVTNPGDWKPGASVNGAVVIEEHPDAVVVPETSTVLRPAGTVVYVVGNNTALQRVVTTGVRQNGGVEILSGLKADETIAVDGAGFLTDKAAVTIKQPDASPTRQNK
ncbi:MAG: efflux RND transporter periplasmic adaptor subunit [Sulfuricellaceae bacterium]|nr:efflux RND transporter periplasmic adaptor subunit [Sulfuricellaceae bacterium]